MTSGEQSGTSGRSGISGFRGFRDRPWLAVALVGSVVAFVNTTSVIMEHARSGRHMSWLEPLCWEGTSFVSILAMAPLIGMAVRRWPPRADNWAIPGLIHFGLTIPFAAAHILAICILRESLYALAGQHYGFFDDGVLITALYEWRKDVLVYAAIAAVYWWYVRQAERPPPQPGDNRIEIRDGATATFVDPADILRLEAAGNYVEFHTRQGMKLVRGTLAAWEAKLAPLGFVRAHRSRVINRARIRAVKPTTSGDLTLTLDDGSEIAASRRYREALEGGGMHV